jgi:prepilin-type N-terminal cleavage/methylation domain-containing protein
MIKKQEGFSLTELMITMAIFVVFLAAASGVFTGLLTQFKQQSKLAETSIEGMIGLETLREDVEQAGYGLPQNLIGVVDVDGDGNFWEHLTNYYEAASTGSSPNPASFNDGNAGSGTNGNPPRAILSGDNSGLNGSDYLVVKALNVARNFAAGKWQHLFSDGTKKSWIPRWENVCRDNNDDLYSTVRTIVISPGSTDASAKSLVVSGGNYFSIDIGDTASGSPSSGFWPATSSSPNIMYGIDPNTDLRMPFNRADYYISNSNVPSRCAPNTGVLVKATINHGDGLRNAMPLLDCVADFQVDYWLDTDADGIIDWSTDTSKPPSDDISGLTAKQIRDQVREVRVYIVAQDGQRDMNYDFSKNNTREYLSATEFLDTNSRTINFINLKTLIGDPEYKYYHWKVYTVIANPTNLR